jgi:hypothetical protein
MNIDFLIKNADYLFNNRNKEKPVLNYINDESYLEFIKHTNGGYFFNKSLLIYGFGNVPKYASFVDMNLLINGMYNSFVPKAQYWGCDFLGNQFAFFENNVCFFNIETGQFEVLSRTFEEWLDVIYNDLNHYSGQSLVVEWEKENKELDFNERLCPKKPFVMGGEYVIENLFSLNIESVINYNYEIADQISNISDGTRVILKVTE